MIKKLKRLVTNLSIASALFVPVLAPITVHAADVQIENNLCSGANLTVDSTCDDDQNTNDRVNTLLANIINIFSLVVGVVAVIMIIIGGLKYITSGGESTNITGAKNTILYAVIGLVVVALAQFIVRFVLARATSVE